MVVAHFLNWINTARVAERASAAGALARAFVENELPFEDRCAAEAALTLLLDDPSSKVRQAMAEALSMSRYAPAQIIAALASDQPEVASLVIGRSPLITDLDLIDRVATGTRATQLLVARRSSLSKPVAAALAEVGELEPCVALVQNRGADIAAMSFRRLAERLGHEPSIREALIADSRLPADCRHLLLVKLGEALSQSPLICALMGHRRAERVTRDACAKASMTVIDGTRSDDYGALIEHLRLRGDLTAGFLVRAVAHGKIDFLGAVLVALTAQSEQRVKSLLADGGELAIGALLRSARLSNATQGVILRAVAAWRDVARGRRIAGAQEISWLMLQHLGGQAAEGDLATLLKTIHLDCLRENARDHALAIAAA
jgi:uncharacterized protein (DUF2336 family)